MTIYTLEKNTIVKAPIEKVWKFFSTPKNLNELTPPDLSFEILTPLEGVEMYGGLIINYKIRPFLQIPMRWTTEITHCETQRYFVDEQRFGPYAFWHHQHHFEARADGVHMKDIVHYALPMGPLGRLANAIYVAQKLEHIFDYREEIILQLFPSSPPIIG
jgi:ligand-binding SRPBCC domain-containing protein